jgi:hypothetical protein
LGVTSRTGRIASIAPVWKRRSKRRGGTFPVCNARERAGSGLGSHITATSCGIAPVSTLTTETRNRPQ